MPFFPYYNLYNRKPPYFNNYRFNYIPNTNFTPPTPQVPHQSQPKQTPEPYLRDSKKDKLDQYVNLLNVSKIAELMNKNTDNNKPI